MPVSQNNAVAIMPPRKRICMVIGSTPERISKYVNSLRPLGLDYHFFANQATFMTEVKTKAPDLIILDVVDKRQGLHNELAGLLDKLHHRPAIVLAVVSEHQRPAAADALVSGLSDYVTHPFSEVELLARVRMHLGTEAQQAFEAEIQAELEGLTVHEDRVILRNSLWQLKDNLSALRTVSDLALMVGCSEKALNAVFQTAYGCTAFDYMRNTRMQRARQLLAETRVPIIQIASDLAYSSAANFSTAFKAVVGMSPRAYRQSHHQAAPETD